MGLGIGLGRAWLSGRYAVSCSQCILQERKGRSEEEDIRQTDTFTKRWTNKRRRHLLTQSSALNSFSANRPRPQTPLDSIKFVCKDLWPLLFRKQIDNLKTNHRGVFVLTDQRFQPISRVSVDRKAGVKAPEETLSRAQAVSSIMS